jgi:hypothetical protein
MIKYFCDTCGSEEKRLIPCEIPCHLWSFRGQVGYQDNNGHRTSGRNDCVQICRKCHNSAYSALVKVLLEIKENTQ